MRKIGLANSYLKNQSCKYLSRAILSFLLFSLLLILTGYHAIFQTQNVSLVDGIGFVISLIWLVVFQYYQRKYHTYKGGRQGEKAVVNALTNSLSDEYYLINGVYLKGRGGDIDHIVLGPSGVYVLETKNWSGEIICHGDQWQRPGKKIKNSPSLQAKYNTQKVKKLIDPSHDFRGFKVWIEGLLVFTNTYADLCLNNPTVTVLRLQQLTSYIKKQENNRLTNEQIQKIIKQIQNA